LTRSCQARQKFAGNCYRLKKENIAGGQRFYLKKKKKKKKTRAKKKKKKKKKELGACRRLDFPAKGFLQYSWTDRT